MNIAGVLKVHYETKLLQKFCNAISLGKAPSEQYLMNLSYAQRTFKIIGINIRADVKVNVKLRLIN